MRRGRWLTTAGIICLLVGLWLAAQPPAAQAHGYLIRSIPANRAVLERPPARLQAWFSEGLEPRFTSMSLTDERGREIPLSENGVPANRTSQLSARIAESLPDGVYVMTLRVAFASDGHVFTERLIFWVGQQAAQGSGEVTAASSARQAEPLEILWRSITLPALHVLFGAALLYQLALLPAWGNARYRAGRLPPRVMQRLIPLIWVALITALLGTLLALLQQSAALFGASIVTVLQDGLWQVVLNGTQIGDTIRLRLILIGVGMGLQAAALYFAPRIPDLVAPLWTMTAFVGAAALGTISISSHAAGADLWLLPSIAAHWLHILATGAWVGGLVGLAVVLSPALAPLPEGDRRAALLAVLRRFSVIGAVAVALLVATGVYNSAIQIRQPGDLVQTDYGLTYLAKIALIVPLLLLALRHHLIVSEDWLTRVLQGLARRFHFADLAHRLDGSLRLEVMLAVAVLVAAGVMAATPPPVPAPASTTDGQAAPTVTLPDPAGDVGDVGDLTVRLSVDPGSIGANGYEAALTRGDQPVEGAQVWLRFNLPTLDRRTKPLPLDGAGDGLYMGAGPELERVGPWQAWLDIQLPATGNQAGQWLRAAFSLNVSETPPGIVVRTPSLLNWFGVLLIAAALIGWLGPLTYRQVRRFGWNREIVILGGAAAVVTLVFMIGGAVVVINSDQQLDALRNPPPRVVNPTLADQQSVMAGRELFEIHCAECHQSADRTVFAYTLGNRRDEDVYRVIRQGMGKMPPFPPDTLDEQAVWQVINYLRSAAFAPLGE